jgi:uncharacterized membrane protein
MYSKHRLEALSDAIFAIVMTLLVLELKVPNDVVHGQLWPALRLDGEDWVAFVITFFISARYWMLQHNVFKLTEGFTHHAAILTFLFLGFVTILPFSSTLLGRHISEPLAIILYLSNQAAIGLALIAKLEFIRLRDHIPKSLELTNLRLRLYTLTIVMIASAICIHFFPIRYLLSVPAIAAVISGFFERRNKRAAAKHLT